MWTQQIPIWQILAQDAASTFRLVEAGSSQNSYPAFHSIIGLLQLRTVDQHDMNQIRDNANTLKTVCMQKSLSCILSFLSLRTVHIQVTDTVYIVLLLKPPFLGGSTFAASSRLKSIVACCTTIRYPWKPLAPNKARKTFSLPRLGTSTIQ